MKIAIVIFVSCTLILSSCFETGKKVNESLLKKGVPQDEIQWNSIAHNPTIPIDSNSFTLGQLLYVPTYANVEFTEDKNESVSSNLSIRNTSLSEKITILYVDYYDDHGIIIRNYIDSPLVIGPLGSEIFHISQYGMKGGAGSNFLIEWSSEHPVTPPYVENVTFRLQGARTMGFSSSALVLGKK